MQLEDLNILQVGPEDAPAVLLLHGWGSNAALMQPIASRLASRYRVTYPDLPGHGESPVPPEPWGVHAHALLVQRILEHSVEQPAHIIGHSNGGRIALYMACNEEFSKHIKSLILISPSGITPRRSLKYYFKKTLAQSLKFPVRFLPEKTKPYANDWLRHTLIWQSLGSSDYRQTKGVMRETFVKLVNDYVDDCVQQIKKPTLLFWGDLDTAISRYQMEQLERKIEGSALITLPNADHYGYLQAPGPFFQATEHFLDHLASEDQTSGE